MKIGGLQKLTLIDYPNTLACTVFLSGCNFRCPWCYSPELVSPALISHQPEIKESYFFDFLKTKKGLLDGVVICGGEPTIHEELPLFCSKIKNAGYKVKLDTNGSNPEMLEKLFKLKLVDYVAMDIKAPKEKYAKAIGFEGATAYYLLDKIEKSIVLLKNGSIEYEFRTTVVPGLHTKEDVIQIANWIKPAPKYFLQQFRPQKTLNPEFEERKPLEEKEMFQIKECIAPFFEISQNR
ncbi:MAG: anaerobic ribonucleoside-triphosphate reductase activating protein [Candidatus Pacebacteria bacterium]|nr:anaerobic ribonucleoside-triphosphate reductase activating protein [Candidatus Paceibacterota bacterium]